MLCLVFLFGKFKKTKKRADDRRNKKLAKTEASVEKELKRMKKDI